MPRDGGGARVLVVVVRAARIFMGSAAGMLVISIEHEVLGEILSRAVVFALPPVQLLVAEMRGWWIWGPGLVRLWLPTRAI